MIRCLKDALIDEGSECYYCCCYCDDKDCSWRCELSFQTEEIICQDCVNAFDLE